MITKFIDILEAIGLYPSLDDVADILWLGQELDRYSKKTKAIVEQAESNIAIEPIELRGKYEPKIQEKPLTDEAILHDDIDESEETPFDISDFSDQEDEAGSFEKERADIFPESVASEKDELFTKAIDGIPLGVPGGSALPGKLAIARSLRPLMMKVPSRTIFQLNEEATAERVAELDRWDPVLRAEPSCWLDAILVVDESPSMSIWRDTILEFRELLERQGAFRNVQTKGLLYNKEKGEIGLYSGGNRAISFPVNPKELIDPTRRRLIIIVSDCVAHYWHEGLIYKMLEEWSVKNRVALLQMLPYDLWNQTGLRKYDQVYLRNTNFNNTNCQLRVEKTSIDLDIEDPITEENKTKYKQDQKVPIITLEPRSLLPWSKSLTGRGSLSIPGVLFQHPDKLKSYVNYPDSELDSALDPIAIFQAISSPEAQKLARYLAAIPLTLPIMRLVQRVLLPETRQIHLAEVILSRLVEIKSETTGNLFENSNEIYYDFVDDVRNRLLRDNYLSETISVMDTVFRELSVFIDQNTGKPISFRAIVGNPLLIDDLSVDAKKHPFASVSVEVLNSLGGKYTRLSEMIKSKLRSKDKSLYPEDDEVKEPVILGQVESLKKFDENFLFHPGSFILNLHTCGDGGVGKTHLLLQMQKLCRTRYAEEVITGDELIDFYHTESRSQVGIIEQIIEQLGRDQFLILQDKLDKYRRTKDSSERQYLLGHVLTALKKDYEKIVATVEQENKTIALFFDTYEVIQRVEKENKDAKHTDFSEWLETKLFPVLRSSNTRIIVAGRYPIDKAHIEVEERILALFDFSAATDFLIECLRVAEFSEKSYQDFIGNHPSADGFLEPYRSPLGDNRVGIWICDFPDDYRLELGEKVWQELTSKVEVTCQDDLLDELGLTENEFRTLFHPTGFSNEKNVYRPIYLALFMDWWRFNLGKHDPAELLKEIQQIGNKDQQQEAFNRLLVQRVGQNYKERIFIYRMAVAYRRMTGEIMQHLTGYSFEYCQTMLLEKLALLSFVKHKQCEQKGDVVLLHDEMRDLLEKYWQEEDPGREQYKEISWKLVCYYTDEFLSPDYQLTSPVLSRLRKKGVPESILDKVTDINSLYFTETDVQSALKDNLNQDEFDEYASVLIHAARQKVSQAKREVYVPELIEYAFMADADDGTKRFCKEFGEAMEDGRYPYAAMLGREAEYCCAKYSGSPLNALEIKLKEVQYYFDSDKKNIQTALKIIESVNKQQRADGAWEGSLLCGKFKMWTGIAYFSLDKFDEAIRLLKEARGIFIVHKGQEDPMFLAENWIGYTYYRKAYFNEAEGWMQQSLEGLLDLLTKELDADKTRKRNLQQRIQYVYGNLARLYCCKGKFTEAIRYAEAQFNIVKSLPRNKKEIFRSLNTMAHVLVVAGRSMDARYYLEQAEKVYKEIPDRLLGGRLYINFSLLLHDSLGYAHMIEYCRAEELRDAIEKLDRKGDGQEAEQMKKAVGHITKAIDILKGEPNSPVVAHKELADAYFNLGELYMMTPEASTLGKWKKAEQAFLQAMSFAETSQFRYCYIDALESLVTLYYFWNRAAEKLSNETKVENEQKKGKYQEKLANLHSEIKGYPSLRGRYELTLGDIAFDNALDLIKDGTFQNSDFRAGVRLLKASFDHYVSSALFKKEFNRDRYYLVLRVLYNRLNTLIRKMGISSRWVFDWLEKYRKEWAYQIPEFSTVFDYVVSLYTIPEDGEKIISHVKQQIKKTEETGDLRHVILLNKCLTDGYRLIAKTTGKEKFQEKLVGRLNRQGRVHQLMGDVHSTRLCYEHAREAIAGGDTGVQITDPVLKRGLSGCTDIVEGEFYFRQGGYGSLLEYFLHDELPYARRRFDRQFKGFRKKALVLLTRGTSRLEKTLEKLQLPERVHGAEAKKQKVFLYKQIRYYYRQLAEAYFQLGELEMMNGHFQENDQDGPGAFKFLKQAIEACEASENYYRYDYAVQSYLNAIYFSGNYDNPRYQEEIKKYERELEGKINVDEYQYPRVAARFRITQGDVLFSRYFKMEDVNRELESYSVVPRQAEVNRGELLAIFRKYVEACEYKARFNDLSFEAGLRVLRRRIELIPDSASLDILSDVLRQIWQEGKHLRRKTEELNSILQLVRMKSLTGSLIQRYEQ